MSNDFDFGKQSTSKPAKATGSPLGCALLFFLLTMPFLTCCGVCVIAGAFAPPKQPPEKKAIVAEEEKKTYYDDNDKAKVVESNLPGSDHKDKVLVKGHWSKDKYITSYLRNAKDTGTSKK